MPKTLKTKQPTDPQSMKLLPEDHKIIEQLRNRFKLQGMKAPDVVRIALRRLLEEVKAA